MPDSPPTSPDTLIARFKGLLHQLHLAMIQARRSLDRDVEHRMAELATESSARYVLEHMLAARPVRAAAGGADAHELLRQALDLVTVDGFTAEFGVHSGTTIRLIAAQRTGRVYGFDSFEGLPEAWHLAYGKGHFDRQGAKPEVPENVTLVKGWFEDTLPKFAAEIEGPAAFLHVDCDLYSSTRTVFEALGDRVVPGTVIVFDEYLNYPGWEQHEARAFREFCAARAVTYRYVAFTPAANSVAVLVTGVGAQAARASPSATSAPVTGHDAADRARPPGGRPHRRAPHREKVRGPAGAERPFRSPPP